VAKLTIGIAHFNLRTSQVRKKGKDWFGSVRNIHLPLAPSLPPVFVFSLLNSVAAGEKERGRPRKTWMEGVQAAMTTGNLGSERWRNREEWRLVCERQ
jgi:hypothetical protein